MNAFSPLEIRFSGSNWLPRLLYGITPVLGLLALTQLAADPARHVLILIIYTLVGIVVFWKLLLDDRADEVQGLNWDVEHQMMSVLTASAEWVPVDKLYRRLSVPGYFQLLVLQRRDRALPSWVWITPDRLRKTEARRLHVAIRWAAPIAQNPATGN
ncbi:hypothetical protein [Marinobacterium marinum]|uniref:Toxin CptA n=1 Tax=Marinobacterium marinum TaxID=2756129 RepID=A0A7W1WW96_9GAMM|nr:hypothetical protein [Marinobacterium marinum]MBA4501364.1 hypothetical protein [Marinobacterium marinum]